MKVISIALLCMLLAGTVAALDPRVSYAVPMLPADPSLKTTDPFYAPQPIAPGYQLPAIFGGPVTTAPAQNTSWMNLSEHDKKLNSSTEKITALNSYALNEWQMRDVPLGEENYL